MTIVTEPSYRSGKLRRPPYSCADMSFRILFAASLLGLALPVFAGSNVDGYGNGATDCPLPSAPLDVAGVVAQALCRNPDTRTAWLTVQAQQARLKGAKSAYYPTLDLSASQTHGFGDGGSSDRTNASLSAGWLLYDFGGRAADKRQAQQVLSALQASQENTTQKVMQAAVDAYYVWYAADEALVAARASEDAARETLRATETRQRVGAGTLADVLQARTALSQASLSVIQRDGTREIARGTVAQALGLPAPSTVTLAPPPENLPTDLQPPAFDALAAALPDRRPDLRAQKLTVEAAKASYDSIDAQDRPSISLAASDGLNRSRPGASDTTESGSIGLQLKIPLFAGGRYQAQEIVAARQVDIAETEYERQKLNASSELWTAWQGVRTSAATVGASHDLVASASEAHRAALARYRAGLGSLIDVLNAQSTLADARQQEAAARFNWHRARVLLIKSSGVLNTADIDLVPAAGTTPSPTSDTGSAGSAP